MPNIEDLSAELGLMILENLGEDFLPTIHASPWLRAIFFANEVRICRPLFPKHVDRRLYPLIRALCHAETTAWEPNTEARRGAYTQQVIQFTQEHLGGPLQTPGEEDQATFRILMVLRMPSFYRVVEEVVPALAGFINRTEEPNMDILPHEWVRFAKCVYIHELARTIVPCRPSLGGGQYMSAWRTFWSTFAPWQVAGIQVLEAGMERLAIKAAYHTFRRVPIRAGTYKRSTDPYLMYRSFLRNEENPDRTVTKIALRSGVRAFHLYESTTKLPIEFFESPKRMCRTISDLNVPAGLWPDICQNYLPECAIAAPHRGHDILSVAHKYSSEDPGTPLRLWMWWYLHQSVRSDSPLKPLVRWWKDFFLDNRASRGFGLPCMGRFGFVEWEDDIKRLPTLQELMNEATAIPNTLLAQPSPSRRAKEDYRWLFWALGEY
ncbi:hypothetical protein F4821DRAFT_274300 [Hypoxylon rubiginosum]|uniref:Uncharacterized protein n=1 Tax=Hypoxylon rubiginosum TaxID=110542 RepID=A0ACC0DDB6_9PEZI|nr:hypothetical protein F4821DRAFT_274300 [Hypoxylon rubiginosum]